MKLLYRFHYRTKRSSAIRSEVILAENINEARLIFRERCGKKATVVKVCPELPTGKFI